MATLYELFSAGKKARKAYWNKGEYLDWDTPRKIVYNHHGGQTVAVQARHWMETDWEEYREPEIYERWLVLGGTRDIVTTQIASSEAAALELQNDLGDKYIETIYIRKEL